MADPEIRIAQKLYCQITGTVPTDKLQVFLDGDKVYEKNGNLQPPEEVVTVDYSSLTAGSHALTIMVVDQNDDPRLGVFTRTWTTLHDGIPTVGIDENNAIRVDGELLFVVWAESIELLTEPWLDNGYINASGDTRWHPHEYLWEYTKEEHRDWLTYTADLGIRNVGPAAWWAGIAEDDNYHGRGIDLEDMRDYVESLRDHPGVLMWLWADEVDGGGQTRMAYPAEVRSWTDLCHQYDTNHPHYVNLTAYDWARDRAWSEYITKMYSYLYSNEYDEWRDQYGDEKRLIADVIGFDFYPIEYGSMVDYGGIEVNFETMAKALDRIREYNYDLSPIISWNENCDLHPEYTDSPPCTESGCPTTCSCTPGVDCCTPGVDCPASTRGGCRQSQPVYLWTPAPTASEMWAEYWIKVIHGVKGFRIHAHFSPECIATPPNNHETMAKFLSWMDELKYPVLGPDYEGTVTDEELGGGRIDIMVKADSDYLYIFAANLRYENETVRFTLDEVAEGAVVEVYGEGRTISLEGNSFTDEFEDIEVHIYRIAREPLSLRGTPADRAIHLNWTVNVTLPVTSTWHIDYYTTTLTAPFTATNSLSTTRAYTLTDHVINYQWYTVTLYAMLDELGWLSDTARVMPTDIFVYLPVIMKSH